MDFHFDFAQIVGLIATAFIIVAYSFKNDTSYRAIASAGGFLFSLHFFMLGAFAGSAVNLINGFRSISAIHFHKSKKLMLFFMALYIFSAFFVVEEFIDALPFLNGLLGAYAIFQLSGIRMRLVMLVVSGMWMAYNIIFMSIGGIITECFVLTSNCITIYRIFRDNKKLLV